MQSSPLPLHILQGGWKTFFALCRRLKCDNEIDGCSPGTNARHITPPQEEYALLCEENGIGHEGFDLHNFVEFVNDTSGTGCTSFAAACFGARRGRICHVAREGSKQPGSLFKVFPCIASPTVWFFFFVQGCPRCFWRHHKSVAGFWEDTFLPTAPLRASRSGPRDPPAKGYKELESRGREKTDDSGGREAVIRELFSVLDRDADGVLSQAELRPFAEQSGFEGGDQEWLQEFRLLCGTCGTNGFSMEVFVAMLNDTSKDGMYCPDTELVAILRALRSRQASAARGRAGRDQASGTRARLAAKLPTAPAVKEPLLVTTHRWRSCHRPQVSKIPPWLLLRIQYPSSEDQAHHYSMWVRVCVGHLVHSYQLQFFVCFPGGKKTTENRECFQPLGFGKIVEVQLELDFPS